MTSIAEELLECEKKLLDPVLRRTPERLAALLSDDFVEFASSGRTYDKQQILYRLSRQLPAQLTIEEFRLVELAPDSALIAYRARAESAERKGEKFSLRSSVWVRRTGEWKMIFHQGTMVAENKLVEKSTFPFTKKMAGP